MEDFLFKIETLRLLRTIHVLAYNNQHKLEKIMAAIDDFIAAQNSFVADVSSDLDTISTTIDTLTANVASLTAALANAGLTADQQAALNALTQTSASLEAKADLLAGKVATPPVPPVDTTTAPATT